MDDVGMPEEVPDEYADFIKGKLVEDLHESGCTCEPEIEFNMKLIDTGDEDFIGAIGSAAVTHKHDCELSKVARAWMN